LKVDSALAKYEVFEASVGDMGYVTGVVEAIVPPTPVLDVGLVTLTATFLVIEQLVGGTLAVGAIRAGLCGEPMAITKGTFALDEVLGLRGGEEGSAIE
jgi:hypothetical protein